MSTDPDGSEDNGFTAFFGAVCALAALGSHVAGRTHHYWWSNVLFGVAVVAGVITFLCIITNRPDDDF